MSVLSGRHAVTLGGSAAVLAGITMLGTTPAVAAHQPAPRAAAHPAAAATAPNVNIVVTNKVVKIGGGTRLSPGRTIFTVTAKGRQHTLQLIKLHKGYSLSQAKKDINAGVDQGNNIHAIRRLDRRVTWLGGSSSLKGKTSQFAAVLPRGTVYGVDQDGPALIKLKITGQAQGGTVPTEATVTGTAKDTWKAPKVLPADGWIHLRNTSTESHFFAVQRVKASTTKAMVRKYVKSESHRNPPWLAGKHAFGDSGVFSHQADVDYHIQQAPGKYLVACFWPSKDSGMPHFSMGMWKLVHLK